MRHQRSTILAGLAVLAAAGLGAGITLAVTRSSRPVAAPAPAASSAAYARPGYSWYRSMMNGHYGPGGEMMTGTSYGSFGWMMSQAGYQWMTGNGTTSPGWMTSALPAAMMTGITGAGNGTNPGTIMGRLFASAPGPRVSAARAAALAAQVPADARVSRAANTVRFASKTVRMTIVAGLPGGSHGDFRIAGLDNPRVIVPAGARVTIEFINADPSTAHGLVITASTVPSPMPMMTARPSFTGSALWFLGEPTSAGMHEGTLTFTATAPGSYRYRCPVPGTAQEGMTGILTVQ
ncbi:MAG TPA: sulfocyanin-like copper-binding protein [Trebonia sp.]|nr:sulfocyanin-like copper-binding protein [Trebonia sp.]